MNKYKYIDVSKEYRDKFIQAEQTFLYQLIFDPRERKLSPLTPYSQHVNPEWLTFAGRYYSDIDAFNMAVGNVDTTTRKQLDHYNPDEMSLSNNGEIKSTHQQHEAQRNSIWNRAVNRATNEQLATCRGSTETCLTTSVRREESNHFPIVHEPKQQSKVSTAYDVTFFTERFPSSRALHPLELTTTTRVRGSILKRDTSGIHSN